jgi:hypothetical protein
MASDFIGVKQEEFDEFLNPQDQHISAKRNEWMNELLYQ